MGETLKIWKSFVGDVLDVPVAAAIAMIDSNRLQFTPTVFNGIAFDIITKKIWYCDNIGTRWHPISNGSSGSGSTIDFALQKLGSQVIPPGIYTILTSFTTAAPYFDNTLLWNTGTGVYTASDTPHYIILTVDVSWAAGVSNQGSRTVQIIYKPFAAAEQILKEGTTQADPNINEPTTISITGGATLNLNDQIYVKVYHNALVPLTIDDNAGIVGHRTNPP